MSKHKKKNIDMSPAAVTDRLERACGLGDAELLMTVIRSLMAEVRGEKELPELPLLIAKHEGRLLR